MNTQKLDLLFQSGFGNEFSTEAISGALPQGQNSPQQAPLGLYAEHVNGSAFTAPRAENKRSWLYRILPSAKQMPFRLDTSTSFLRSGPFQEIVSSPNPLRWDPLPIPKNKTDFLDGLVTLGGNGDPALQMGVGIHLYAANASMQSRFFQNRDGEMLIVPEIGSLRIRTELGILQISPGMIAVIPKGFKFTVDLLDQTARGYVCENYGQPFRLPELGPIGANGLANARDFLVPVAAYEDVTDSFALVCKFQGKLWLANLDQSPLDVVAWHGNYTPYQYELSRFNTMNTVSFDHPDPSIFTVLSSPSEIRGTANCDFVIFPPRWLVAENTFRPPWFHRNVMSEFMGLVFGKYDAKAEGFVPGGSSLHNAFQGHGPDTETYAEASKAVLSPKKLDNTLAFMFETKLPIAPTHFAMETSTLQKNYSECWQGLSKNFKGAL